MSSFLSLYLIFNRVLAKELPFSRGIGYGYYGVLDCVVCVKFLRFELVFLRMEL